MMMSLCDVLKCAEIPTMGGWSLAFFLYAVARQLEDGCAVECGSWLGSSIAPVLVGLNESGKSPEVHCFDEWRCTHEQAARLKPKGVDAKENQDLLPMFRQYVDPIGYKNLHTHKGMTSDVKSWDNPIGLYIDDCNKKPSHFRHAMDVFGSQLLPGATIVLMDFHFGPCDYQRWYMAEHADQYDLIAERIGNTAMAAFRYRGK